MNPQTLHVSELMNLIHWLLALSGINLLATFALLLRVRKITK